MDIPWIKRLPENLAGKHLDEGGKVLIIYGPRQSGKTSLVRKILSDRKHLKALCLNGDDPSDRRELEGRDARELARLTAGYDCLMVDEAQRIGDIGLSLKLLHDSQPLLRIIATGSSSFELASKTSEALTGRARIVTLYPVAVAELALDADRRSVEKDLDDYLIHGMYPEIRTSAGRDAKRAALKEVTESYLYKDVIEFGGIRHTDRIHDLLRLLAFQVGSEVSIAELASSLSLARDTVDHYIDVLEKAFVVFRVRGYSRNLRKEVSKMDKIYFWDSGVRNMVIGNLAEPALRDDTGRLWENFLAAERRKVLSYRESWAQSWFWRLRTGAEIDYVEESDGTLSGYEFKFGAKLPKAPAAWEQTYAGASFSAINRDNWFGFATGEDLQ